MNRADLEYRANQIVDGALAVHKAIGPGALESSYEACLAYELRSRGLEVLTQVPQPIVYRELVIDIGYRLDMLVDDVIVVELKAVTQVLPVHEAQMISYLKMSGRKLGLLINFRVPVLKDGVKRLVNDL